MALTLAEVNVVSSRNFDKPMTQQVYEDSPFFLKLKKNRAIKWDGGTEIQFPIRYRKLGRADAVGEDQRVGFETKSTRTAGVDSWTYYNVDAMITWAERVKNTGKARIVNLLAEKAEEMEQDMQDRFATDLHTTNPNGLGFNSLAAIVDSAASYAGIAVADASAWASGEDSTTTELVLYGSGSLSYMINAATFGKYGPDMHLTTKDLASKFESLIEPQKRYTDKEMADAGFKNVTFHGVPIFGDPFAVAASWYGLCMKVFELRYHPDFNFDVSEWVTLFQAGFPRNFGKVMSWTGNLICKMRKCNFKFTALDYTI
jgi:hypothetical protein